MKLELDDDFDEARWEYEDGGKMKRGGEARERERRVRMKKRV